MKARVSLNLTSAQEKAMQTEIRRQVQEAQRRWDEDMEAMTLWTLHTCLGFGRKRLLRFRKAFAEEYKRMREAYELDDLYPEKYKLKKLGVDVAELLKEDEDQ